MTKLLGEPVKAVVFSKAREDDPSFSLMVGTRFFVVGDTSNLI